MDIGRIREELVPLQPPFPCVAGRMKRIHQQDFQTSQEGYVSLVGEVGVPPPRVIESDGCFSMTLIGTVSSRIYAETCCGEAYCNDPSDRTYIQFKSS